MAEPTAFVGSNGKLDTPAGHDPLSVTPMVVYRDDAHTLQCWKITADELAEITRTGRVWLWIKGHACPPMKMTGHDPFRIEGGQP